MSVASVVRLASVVMLLLAVAAPAAAQQVLLDNTVRAGELTLFRDLRDEQAYYYAPANTRLATAANGLPEFSFFRWVENVRSGAGEPEAREGRGGGIIHALVTFGVTKEQLAEAQLALRRLVPGARIAGPIVPKSGTFAIISTMQDPKDPNNKFSDQVLGIGNAPLLDGEKAAVSIKLTQYGAKVMWEQFQTPTPDLTFQFEWTVEGFRGPIGGTVEANLDEIVKHDSFAVGISGNFYGAQIKGAFDDLRKSKAITVTQIGDDAKLDAVIKAAYDRLVGLLFDKEPAAAAAAPAAPAGGDGAGETDWLQRAATQLTAARTQSDAVLTANNAITQRNAERQAKREAADAAEKHYQDLQEQLRKAEAGPPAATPPATPPAAPPATPPAEPATPPAEPAAPPAEPAAPPAEPAAPSAAPAAGSDPATLALLRAKVEAARVEALNKRQEATKAGPDEPLKDMPAEPGFALMATYQMKRSRVSGVYRMDFNKHLADQLVLPSRGNLGDMRPLFKTGAFRQVNLDDPLYQQREIVTMIDGLNAEDFGQYINSVSLRLRKTHAGGDITHDEIRINRKNFNDEGANFKLLYGWKGDNDRSRWMDYEYQMVWSFFGGHTVEMPWTKTSVGGITLSPPLQRRSVELQGDPARLAEQGVRAVNVKIFYRAAKDGPEQVKTLTLNAAGPAFVGRIDFVSPTDTVDYEYEIAWRLAGNREVTSGRQKTGFTILNLDDLPRPPEP